jgi:calcineurin-like phosphoesterase family protein
MSLFFSSDLHLGHRNIIKYCKRPFLFDASLGYVDGNLDVRAMNTALINNWNRVVKPTDTAYIIGDVSFFKDIRDTHRALDALNGTKHLIRGNHDKSMAPETLAKFASVQDYLEINVPDKTIPRGRQMIVLSHYAFRVWDKSHYGSWNLYGHSHGSLPDDPNALAIDVGVDCHDYTPISYEQVKAIMATKKWKPADYHGEANEAT